MSYKDVAPPAGEKIARTDRLNVPDQPIIPFIRGDGTGPDIWAASVRVFDAAVEKAYAGKKKIAWFEVFAGQTAKDKFDEWLPDDTVEAFREYLVGIKGPLTTPVGGGIRSLNVALRQLLDLFVCLRPIQYFKGVPSPVKHPEKVNMVIFRENTEDIYAGIEYAAGTPESQKILDFFQKEFPKEFDKIRFGTREQAAEFCKRVGAPEKDDVMVAAVGRMGVAPGDNINCNTGHAVFEATRGTAPKYPNQDKVNPGSVILSGEMMFRYMGWTEAADLILKGLNAAIASKRVTYH